MRPILCFAFAVVLVAGPVGSVFASGKGVTIIKPKAPPIIKPKGPLLPHSHPIARATVRHAVFHPHTHTVWSHHCWLPAHRCYGYYCSTNRVWFYYSASQGIYLPITSIATYPPTPVVNVINLNVNVVQIPGAPALPSGAVFLPTGVTPPRN